MISGSLDEVQKVTKSFMIEYEILKSNLTHNNICFARESILLWLTNIIF